MSYWQQVLWLAKFEYKQIWWHLLLLIPTFILLIIFIVPSMPEYLHHSFFGIDIMFFLAFGVVTGWARPKNFRLDKMNTGQWASSYQLLLQQLPIKKSVIITYRFLTYIITATLFGIVLLGALYVLSPELRATMSISTYIVFSIIWLAYNLYFGGSQLIEEVGSPWRNLILWSLLISFVFVITWIVVFYKWTSFGLVGWTIHIAHHYPIASVIVSIFLTIIGLKYWMHVMKKRMATLDYF